jgi:UDP-N-acetyl-D-galactosamine dehydrogenase
MDNKNSLVVVGLGYVGLPLAAAFGKIRRTIGYDVDSIRIRELQDGFDRNGETSSEDLKFPHLEFTDNPSIITEAEFIVIAVPSPVDDAKQPNLDYLISASREVGEHLSAGAVVVYESTVFPGCTEEHCIPELEKSSGMKAGVDFFVGYSPERINPGDTEHTLETIVKVVSAQDPKTAERLAELYSEVVKAGIYSVSDIRTAEAAKVIENIQRDLNIALMNELSLIFHRMGVDTTEVLQAARTKWNFLPFEPGLVGGHCIPVDPYYLTYKAEMIGHHPEVILAGRRINNYMAPYVAQETIRLLIQAGKSVRDSRILVLGAAFKENVNDLRNTRVVELLDELKRFDGNIFLHDPLVEPKQLQHFGVHILEDVFDSNSQYDAIVLAVPHKLLVDRNYQDYLKLLNKSGENSAVMIDVKGVLDKDKFESEEGVLYWRL